MLNFSALIMLGRRKLFRVNITIRRRVLAYQLLNSRFWYVCFIKANNSWVKCSFYSSSLFRVFHLWWVTQQKTFSFLFMFVALHLFYYSITIQSRRKNIFRMRFHILSIIIFVIRLRLTDKSNVY